MSARSTPQLNTIAQLNGQISQLQALGQPTASLEDQRDQALSQVAGLIGVQSYTRADGTMVVMTAQGRTLVDGETAHTSTTRSRATSRPRRPCRR